MRLLAEARSELREPAHRNEEAPEEATFRDASRIGQFLAVGGAQDSRARAEMLSDGKDGENGTLLQRVRAELETSFFGLIGEASARPGCIPGPWSPSPWKAGY
jgi:hypothetical protein